jgi:xylan 1,4-beta-xylosidase
MAALFCFGLVGSRPVQSSSSKAHGICAVLTGDYADPSIIRVGGDYYMTHSSYTYMPGLLIWHSRDFMAWQRVGYALHKFVGDVWAPDFVYYKKKS